MNRHPRQFSFLLAFVAVAGLIASGCGRDLRSFDEVQAAFDSPSGTLDDSTAPTIFGVSLRGRESNETNQAATSHGQVPSPVGSAMEFMMHASGEELSSSTQALLDGECNANVNLRSDFVVDKITFDCGNSGEVTGKLVLDFDWRGEELEGFYLDYEMFCEAGSCLDGSLGMTWATSGASGSGLQTVFLVTARFDIIRGERVEWVDWAWRMQQSDDEVRLEWLVWTSPDREGTSFVLSAVITETTGYVEVRDAESWWRCEYGEGAREGSCFECVYDGETCEPLEEGAATVTWTTAEG